jgi:chain length determinant protein tyrosine kinase EpsG
MNAAACPIDSPTEPMPLVDLVEIQRPSEGGALQPAPPLPQKQQRHIGAILRELKGWSDTEVARVLRHQREERQRFGEAAIAQGLADQQDVLFALSQQFNYHYVPESRRSLQPELVAAVQPFSRQAEAFRAIRSQLMLRAFAPDEPRHAMAVVSPDSGDGKTFFTANLGVVLAQLGGRVLVIDADLRGPRLHQLFGLPNMVGLSSLLSGRGDKHLIHQAPDIPSLFVLPVGITPPNPTELIERPAFRQLLTDLVRQFDHVLIDTPALRHGSDAYAIAAKCGTALTVARRHHSRMDGLQALVSGMRACSAKLAGVVVNEF